MYKFFLTTTLCVIALLIKCSAQADFQAGYIVNLEGDTIKGLIEYKRWDRTPKKVQFRNSSTSSPTEYYPIQIKSFSVADEVYESAIVDVEQSSYKIQDLDSSPIPYYVRDTVFLQSLIRGSKSLLFLKDRFGKNQFYIKEHDTYTHLLYKQYVSRTETSSKVVMENNEYRGRVALYLKDCPALHEKLRTTKYSAESLSKLFEYFYDCTNTELAHKKERREGRFEAGIVAGATLTHLNFKGPIQILSDVEYGSSVDPTFGVFYDLKLLRSKGWRIANELLFVSFDVKGEESFEDFPDYTASSSFSYSHLKSSHALHIGLFAQGRLYVAGGFSLGYVIHEENELKVIYETGTTSNRKFESRNLEVGYIAGLGFSGDRWNAEFRFEQTSGISNYLNEGSTVTRGYFLVRFRVLKP